MFSEKKKTFLIRSIKDYYINSASNIGRKKKKGDILTKSHLLPDLSGKSTLKKKKNNNSHSTFSVDKYSPESIKLSIS